MAAVATHYKRYGSELFGNIIGFGKSKEHAESGLESSAGEPISRTDAVARLKTDFDRFYFVTGQMDLDLYEPDCVFADPFVAFEGRERFKVGVRACVVRKSGADMCAFMCACLRSMSCMHTICVFMWGFAVAPLSHLHQFASCHHRDTRTSEFY